MEDMLVRPGDVLQPRGWDHVDNEDTSVLDQIDLVKARLELRQSRSAAENMVASIRAIVDKRGIIPAAVEAEPLALESPIDELAALSLQASKLSRRLGEIDLLARNAERELLHARHKARRDRRLIVVAGISAAVVAIAGSFTLLIG